MHSTRYKCCYQASMVQKYVASPQTRHLNATLKQSVKATSFPKFWHSMVLFGYLCLTSPLPFFSSCVMLLCFPAVESETLYHLKRLVFCLQRPCWVQAGQLKTTMMFEETMVSCRQESFDMQLQSQQNATKPKLFLLPHQFMLQCLH